MFKADLIRRAQQCGNCMHAGGIAMAAAVLCMRTCIISFALPLTAISVTCAADQTITLKLGVPTALALERPFKTVLIGNPNIVDIHAINDRMSRTGTLESRSNESHFCRRRKHCDH